MVSQSTSETAVIPDGPHASWSSKRSGQPHIRIVAAAVAELQARWSSLFPSGPAQRRIQLRAEDLEPAIAAWPCGRLLWPDALFHSPDLMIAARDLDAIQRGDLLFVLGELHITINSVIG